MESESDITAPHVDSPITTRLLHLSGPWSHELTSSHIHRLLKGRAVDRKLSSMTSAEEEAVAIKDEGNKAFAAHDWPGAIELYTKAIEKDAKKPAYYSNRAQVSANSLCLRQLA